MVVTNTDYLELRKEVDGKGLLNHTPAYYALNFLANSLLFVILFVGLIYFNNWYAVVIIAFPIAFLVMQFGYMGHDAGHNAISKNPGVNKIMGHLSHSLVFGVSFSYWRYRHNEHHTNPNYEELDPDIANPSPLSFTENQAKKRRGIAKVITRFQSYLLVPAFAIIFSVIKLEAVKYLLKNKKGFLDIALLTAKVLFFLLFIPHFIGFAKGLVFYLIVTLLTNIYFGFVFFPNHLGMPILKGENKFSFIEKQVLTSRDIKTGRILDFIFGGLNYQIEHHLFPNMPRRNFLHVKSIVKKFCQEKNLFYKDCRFMEAWKEVFVYLNDLGKKADVFHLLKNAEHMV